MSAVWDHFILKEDKEVECNMCHIVRRGGKAVRKKQYKQPNQAFSEIAP